MSESKGDELTTELVNELPLDEVVDDSDLEVVPVVLPTPLIVADSENLMRVDQFLAARFPEFSRNRIQTAIRRNLVTVDGTPVKPSTRVTLGQSVVFIPPAAEHTGPIPENVPLDILYEDESIAVINKPAGMVVHPAKGHWSGTLTAALAYHFLQLSQANGAHRPGIIHRLDRDTSGVIVIAKTDHALSALTKQFAKRRVEKTYLAIVSPVPQFDRDIIDKPIGVHPYQREKMAIRDGHSTSRPAITMYEVTERFKSVALVTVHPQTGRTHQIRVHLATIGCPIVADKLYSGRNRFLIGDVNRNYQHPERLLIERQALHAHQISFNHPVTKERMSFTAPLAADMEGLLQFLRTGNA